MKNDETNDDEFALKFIRHLDTLDEFGYTRMRSLIDLFAFSCTSLHSNGASLDLIEELMKDQIAIMRGIKE